MTGTAIAQLEDSIKSASRIFALAGPVAAVKISRQLMENLSESVSAADLQQFGLTACDADTVEAALGSILGEEAKSAIALCLLTLAEKQRAPEIEVCWTGPRLGLRLRSTGPVIEQLIQGAERRILVAEFDIRPAARAILEMLSRRVADGVEVCVLVDRAEQKPDLLRWVRSEPKIEVWSSPRSDIDPLAKFHVKSILVDGKVGMFGSANLTHHGLRGNVELGILVRDARAISQAEDALMKLRKLMVPVPR